MTPEEEQELDKFAAALRGEAGQTGAAGRLGEILRTLRAQALASRDEAGQMRVWKAIDAKLAAGSKEVSGNAWRRLRFAQAAAVFAIGIGAGWFLRPTDGSLPAETHLEFAYGDFERPRGSLVEKTVTGAAPAAALHSITQMLISESVPFELYSLGASGDRRLVFTITSGMPRTTEALREIQVEPIAGQTLSLTFAGAARVP